MSNELIYEDASVGNLMNAAIGYIGAALTSQLRDDTSEFLKHGPHPTGWGSIENVNWDPGNWVYTNLSTAIALLSEAKDRMQMDGSGVGLD